MADEKNIDTGGGAAFLGAATAGRDIIGRDQTNYVQGDQITGALSPMREIAENAPAEKRQQARAQVEKIEEEVKKGKDADDSVLARLLDGFVELLPQGTAAVVSAFASPILGAITGPVTKYVIGKLRSSGG